MLRTLAAVTPPDTAVAIITQRKPNNDKGFEDLRNALSQTGLFLYATESRHHFIRRKPMNPSSSVGFCQRFVGSPRRFRAKPCGHWVSTVCSIARESGSKAHFHHGKPVRACRFKVLTCLTQSS
jgi:hypothetical protein